MTDDQFLTFVVVFVAGVFLTWTLAEMLDRRAVRHFDDRRFGCCLVYVRLSLATVLTGFAALWWFVGVYP